MSITARRDGFAAHAETYYRRALELFAPSDQAELFVARVEDQPIAALMVFRQGRRAWYLYGASSDEHREKMAAYLLQWQAMRWARENGCNQYDLWGVPDLEEGDLEERFVEGRGGLWGVYRFKRGFGGRLHRTAGAYDRVYSRPLYALYLGLLARRLEAAG
jgi:lipid II:glycine glycyltransferase (peptidoglycan interpeptide bridge formation enzyme)